MEIVIGLLCIAFIFSIGTVAGRSLDRAKQRYARRAKGALTDDDLYGDL
jgi:hypothetical protein